MKVSNIKYASGSLVNIVDRSPLRGEGELYGLAALPALNSKVGSRKQWRMHTAAAAAAAPTSTTTVD